MQDRIEVRLELVDGDFVAQVRRGQEVLNSFGSSANGVSARANEMSRSLTEWTNNQRLATRESKSFLSTLRDVSIVAGAASMAVGTVGRTVGGILRPIVEVNAELERLEYLMRGMSTAADPVVDAANKIDYLREKAKNTPFAMATIADSMSKLMSTGIDPLNGSMDALIDGVAAFGGTDEAFKRATLAITQMSGKGVIQMEELRQQLGESMPRAVELMARSFGISVPRLIKDISTGTVESKRALELFNMELQRTYGGAALRQMDTFNGMIRRFQSSLQDLAKEVGDAGFMDELKKQLGDIIEYLNSDQAVGFAKSLGESMAEAMRWIRQTVETVIEFRNEIERTAVVLGTAFVASRVLSGLGAIMTSMRNLRTEMTAIARTAALQKTLGDLSTGSSAASTGMQALRRDVRLAAVEITAFGRAVTAATPYIGLLILALQLGAEWFDVFNSKGTDAYDTIMKVGAASREQYELGADEAKKRIEELKAEQEEIRKAMGTREAYIAKMARRAGAVRGTEFRRQVEFEAGNNWDVRNFNAIQRINNIQGKIDGINKTFNDAQAQLEEEEARRRLEIFRKSLTDKASVASVAYDKEQVEIQDRYNKLENEANKAGKSTQAIQDARARELLQSRLKFHDEEIRLVREAIDAEDKLRLQAVATRNEKGVADRQNNINESNRRLNELLAQRVSLTQQIAGSPIAAKGLNEAAMFERGEKKLASLKAEVEGLRAEFTGASAEVVELQTLLTNGKYGDLGVDQVKELVSNILTAQNEVSSLKDLLKGQKEFENDVASTQLRLRERMATAKAKLEGRELTETEKLRIKMEAGGYEALGPNSPIQKGMKALGDALTNTSGLTDNLAKALQQRAFGAPTMTAMDQFITKLGSVQAGLTNLTNTAGSLNFDNMQGSFGAGAGFAAYNGPLKVASGDAMLDLIASKESGGDYNSTLDHGRWTNGPQNLVSMTLNEVRQLQRQMLANPENRAKYGDGKGSSALGRYQIVGKTLQGLMEEMGLSGDELYDQKMQDRMARHLLQRRAGQGVQGLRSEWEGLKGVPADVLVRAMSGQAPIGAAGPTRANAARLEANNDNASKSNVVVPSRANASRLDPLWERRNAAQTKFEKELDETGKIEGDTLAVEGQAEIKVALEANKRLIEETKDEQAGLNKNYAATVKLIKDGSFGKDAASRNPENERYKDLLKSAKEVDAAEQARDKRREARGKVEGGDRKFGEQQIELQKRTEEAFSRINDPLEIKSSSAFRKLRQDWEGYLADVADYYGRETTQYQDALAARDAALKNFRSVEVAEKAAGWAQQTIQIKRSLMTEREQRAEALAEQIQEIDRYVQEFKGSEEEKVQIVATAEAQKAQLRAQFAAQDPMGRMMKDWGDLQGNLEKASVQWMGSLADGISGLITGTGDLKSVLDGMLKDIVNMGVKYAMSGMMGGMKGGSGIGGKTQTASKAMKGASAGKGVGLFHTGGVIGASGSARTFINTGVFTNARKYHSGNIIGGRSLAMGEVPIIAKRGEGVFTPEQMAAIGAGMSSRGEGNPVNISSNVTVNASGGSSEQNADLAKQVSKQVEAQMRAVVQQELRTSMRPGGTLRGGR